MTAIGYIRVSTNGQKDRFGPKIQRKAIEQWAAEHSAGDPRIFSDNGVSGKLLDRPALADALTRLGEGDVLVVARLDRLARDLIVQELLFHEIHQRGAEVVSCADGEQAYIAEDETDPSRKLIRLILGAVAEYERDMVKLRLTLGRRAKRERGGYAGGETPFGWRVAPGAELELDEREWRVVQAIMLNRDRGKEFAEIADMLNSVAGYHPRRSRTWTKQKVHRVLRGAERQLARAGLDPPRIASTG